MYRILSIWHLRVIPEILYHYLYIIAYRIKKFFSVSVQLIAQIVVHKCWWPFLVSFHVWEVFVESCNNLDYSDTFLHYDIDAKCLNYLNQWQLTSMECRKTALAVTKFLHNQYVLLKWFRPIIMWSNALSCYACDQTVVNEEIF